ncbi:hypothetical protein [Cohnella cholangitidis]|uniref:Lipoprotein n=1 Tax=Cohnella cholangitidis TaxID=2598458 RepID=A0A7G5C2J3_9BACL|nr:hypothetical protein [Cohnella cholangitidis]QMV43427.1 hypothetical protein FPL14_21305 [Cohnella cholangitidis]
MTQEEKKRLKYKPGKLAALTLLLTVPVMMTGCGQLSSNDECDPDYEECVYDDDDGVYVYSSGSKKKYKTSSSGSSSKSYSGFGSGGKSSSGG